MRVLGQVSTLLSVLAFCAAQYESPWATKRGYWSPQQFPSSVCYRLLPRQVTAEITPCQYPCLLLSSYLEPRLLTRLERNRSSCGIRARGVCFRGNCKYGYNNIDHKRYRREFKTIRKTLKGAISRVRSHIPLIRKVGVISH
ncbi:unnamed protein product [Ixodes persulcatus]